MALGTPPDCAGAEPCRLPAAALAQPSRSAILAAPAVAAPAPVLNPDAPRLRSVRATGSGRWRRSSACAASHSAWAYAHAHRAPNSQLPCIALRLRALEITACGGSAGECRAVARSACLEPAALACSALSLRGLSAVGGMGQEADLRPCPPSLCRHLRTSTAGRRPHSFTSQHRAYVGTVCLYDTWRHRPAAASGQLRALLLGRGARAGAGAHLVFLAQPRQEVWRQAGQDLRRLAAGAGPEGVLHGDGGRRPVLPHRRTVLWSGCSRPA